jgi:hypothetical protein
MALTRLPEGLPGVVGPPTFGPDTTKPLPQRAGVLLRGPHALASMHRKIIAAQVSYRTKDQ